MSATAGLVRGWRRDRTPILAFVGLASALLVLQALVRPGGRPRHLWPVGDLLQGWVQFDGPEYLAIASQGYQQRQLVWFPVYPNLIRGLDAVLGDRILAAVVISLVGGLVAACLYWRWTALQGVPTDARRTALAVFLLYPYGWFLYGVVYSDAVFVALALTAFVLVERDHPVVAGLAAAVTTATRPSGLAVAAGLLVVALERSEVLSVPDRATGWTAALRLPTRVDLRRMRPSLAGVLLAWGGFVAYGAYQWSAWGSPIRFASEQSRYHYSGSASLLKQQYFEAWYQGFDGRHLATTTAQGVLLLVVLLSVPAVGRRFGWGYAVLVGGLAVLPAISVETFMGIGRYLMPAFPCFVLAGEWLARRRLLRILWLAVAAIALGTMSFGFSRSWYLT